MKHYKETEKFNLQNCAGSCRVKQPKNADENMFETPFMDFN